MPADLVIIRHWLPIVTFCPVNNLPDLLYVSLEFKDGKFRELYELRKKIRKLLRWRRMFMEGAASKIAYHFPEASAIEIRLAFNRHVIRIEEKHVPIHKDI